MKICDLCGSKIPKERNVDIYITTDYDSYNKEYLSENIDICEKCEQELKSAIDKAKQEAEIKFYHDKIKSRKNNED